MNCTGTERQRAVIAAFRMKPEASQAEIARAAGVTQAYASITIQDYLESKVSDQACQVPACTTRKPEEKDVASFAVDRRFGGNSGPTACAAKERAIRIALAANPRAEGEATMKFCRRISAIAGVTSSYVCQTLRMIEYERIGAAARAKEAEEAKLNCHVVPFSGNIGPVTNFRGWPDTFSKFKVLSEAYLNLARQQGEVFAAAFLQQIQETSERAINRALLAPR